METVRTYTCSRLLMLAAIVAIAPLALSQPLKVRGGAMTFSTDPDNGDSFVVSSPNNYCVYLGPATVKLALRIIQPNGEKTDFPLTSTAQIDLFGRKPDGNKEGPNGVQILISSSTCGSNNGLIASIKPETSASGFYTNRDNATDEDNAHIERFQDSTCRPESSTVDADSCERLKRIYIHDAQTSDPKAGGLKLGCHNGECVLKIIYQP